jgi:D-alanine transaminase
VVTARSTSQAEMGQRAEAGIFVVTLPDNRWERVDIKTVGLLPNCLAKEAAKAAGAREAWFVDRDGFITEGGSSNAWIVSAAGVLITRPAEFGILRGITRTVTLEVAARLNLNVEERAFTREEAYAATEAFVTSATLGVMPVVRIDGRVVGDGKPGRAARALRATFHSVAEIAA